MKKVLQVNIYLVKNLFQYLEKEVTAKNGRFIEINGASGNNLKKVNLKIPVGTFTCVTGVSGSGKSTLILHTFIMLLI